MSGHSTVRTPREAGSRAHWQPWPRNAARTGLLAVALVLTSCGSGATQTGSATDGASATTSSTRPGEPTTDEPTPTTGAGATEGSLGCGEIPDVGGGRVAFTVGDGVSNGIAAVNVDGSEYVDVVTPGEHRAQPHAGTESPRWARDDRIVFSSNRSGGPDDWHVFIVDAVGGEPVQVTDGDDGIEFQPVITPDGTHIVYGKAVATPDGPDPYRDAGIFVSDVDGENERQLTTAPNGGTDEWPDVSPDGQSVVFSRARSADGGLYVVSMDGSGLTQIVDAEMQPYRPRWSPDGTLIVFSSNADRAAAQSANVWVVGRDGSGLRQLTNETGAGQAWAPDWSPSGKRIVYVHERAGRGTNDLDVIDLDGEHLCALWAGSGTQSPMDPDWGPGRS